MRGHALSALMAASLAATFPWSASAQDTASPTYIVPSDGTQRGVYSTHSQAQQPSFTLPWQRPPSSGGGANAAPGTYQPKLPPPGQIPFGYAAPNVSQPAPTGPRTTEAIPVPGVDAVEVSTPAPAEAPAPGANPAAENPATPTAQTSPIFTAEGNPPPKKIIFRALNKVTGQSALIGAKPGEVAAFGNLDITALTCQTSTPSSQLDYAGLFDLREHMPGQLQPKQLFHGWMYASSPSITSLEHPIYDLTMIKCETPEPAKLETKQEEKKSSKKKPTKS